MILQDINSKKKGLFYGVNAASQVQKFSLYNSGKKTSRWMLRFRTINYAPNGKFHNEWSGPLCTGTNKKHLLAVAQEAISRSTTVNDYKALKKILLQMKQEITSV